MGKTEIIVETLKNEIRNGKYPPGTRFPSEYRLSSRFEVNGKTDKRPVSALPGRRGAGIAEVVMAPKYEQLYVTPEGVSSTSTK